HGPGEDRNRVAIALPRDAVHAAEERLGPRMPRPPQVVGQASQAFELGWQPERDVLEGLDPDRLHVAGIIPAGPRIRPGSSPPVRGRTGLRCPGRSGLRGAGAPASGAWAP